MDTRANENFDELPTVETPEDVAVLYSWANLHGAKYRDFSASRREYRAQLRHRAAEQARGVEMQAQADAEAAAGAAEYAAERAEETAHLNPDEVQRLQVLRGAERVAQIAAAERIEAARRDEAAAQAEAAARREELEMAEASRSARHQAAIYAENARRTENTRRTEDTRRRGHESAADEEEIPGHISDPYTPQSRTDAVDLAGVMPPAADPVPFERRRLERIAPRESSPPPPLFPPPSRPSASEPLREPSPFSRPQAVSLPRRPRGFRPDDASGVRQIFREGDSEMDLPAAKAPTPRSPASPMRAWDNSVPAYATRETTLPQIQAISEARGEADALRNWAAAPTRPPKTAPSAQPATHRHTMWASSDPAPTTRRPSPTPALPIEANGRTAPQSAASPRLSSSMSSAPGHEDVSAGQLEDPTPKRRRQDMPGYRSSDSDRALAAYRREQGQTLPSANATERLLSQEPPRQRKDDVPLPAPAVRQRSADPEAPAWIYASAVAPEDVSAGAQPSAKANAAQQRPVAPAQPQPTVSDTLQRSRERVASRWYALKGVFEQPGQERSETEQVRQKETRTPVLAVFSLAGGVGKTSLVATLGRSLSSLGEKVLLTDTTSHGLLPFYFGASELRQGSVRTFSPPSGSTDAPIYLVNYPVDQATTDDEAQEQAVEEMANSSRGSHRMLLDLTASTGWVIRRIARLSPTVLVPLAPDMNSVISLQAIERFFYGVNAPDGAPLKVFYVLNQFDAALPLHLDVREVLRRQLGERLLPIVIRRAPAVSEALAEGMTIVDYAPDAPVVEDYMNIAAWLRTQSAPATAGFRNVRWSER